eukprot:6174638-Pleurochrysis_carterae.AAC.2
MSLQHVRYTPLGDGSRLRYPMNGHLAFWLSLSACHLLPLFGGSLTYVYDNYLQASERPLRACGLIDPCWLRAGENIAVPIMDTCIRARYE